MDSASRRTGETSRDAAPSPAQRLVTSQRAWAFSLVIAALVLLAGFTMLLAAVRQDAGLARADVPTLMWFVEHRQAWMDAVQRSLSWFGGAAVLTPVMALVALGLSWRARRWRPFLLLGVTAAVSVGSTVLVKPLIDRARPPYLDAIPPYETSASFPSGHTLNSTALALMLVYIALTVFRARWVQVVAVVAGVLYPVAMAVSRMYMGAHWLTDVAAGWCLGAAVAALVAAGDLLIRSRGARGGAVAQRNARA